MKAFISFPRDLFDRAARKIAPASWTGETLTVLGIALLAATGQAEALQKIAFALVGDRTSLVRLLLTVSALCWCVVVISKKTRVPGLAAASDKRVYSYSRPLRLLAILAAAILMVAIPSKISATVDELVPLPKTIYGYLYQLNGRPIDGANIRLVSSGGEDITRGDWLSDSEGFYIVKADRRIRRSDILTIFGEGCAGQHFLTLRRENEFKMNALRERPGRPELSPKFYHHLSCEDK